MSTTTDLEPWTIDFADSDVSPSEITAFVIESQPAPPLGETASWDLLFRPEVGATDHLERYRALLAFREHVGAYAAGVDVRHRPWYREQHDRESLLVALRPPVDSQTGRGVWGLIDDMEDETTTPARRAVVSLDLLVLADGDDYNSASEVRADFEADGI
jgi:hypothetical protein